MKTKIFEIKGRGTSFFDAVALDPNGRLKFNKDRRDLKQGYLRFAKKGESFVALFRLEGGNEDSLCVAFEALQQDGTYAVMDIDLLAESIKALYKSKKLPVYP